MLRRFADALVEQMRSRSRKTITMVSRGPPGARQTASAAQRDEGKHLARPSSSKTTGAGGHIRSQHGRTDRPLTATRSRSTPRMLRYSYAKVNCIDQRLHVHHRPFRRTFGFVVQGDRPTRLQRLHRSGAQKPGSQYGSTASHQSTSADEDGGCCNGGVNQVPTKVTPFMRH